MGHKETFGGDNMFISLIVLIVSWGMDLSKLITLFTLNVQFFHVYVSYTVICLKIYLLQQKDVKMKLLMIPCP